MPALLIQRSLCAAPRRRNLVGQRSYTLRRVIQVSMANSADQTVRRRGLRSAVGTELLFEGVRQGLLVPRGRVWRR